MPDLDNLRRSLLNALPSWLAASPPNPQGDMQGYVPGQAQTRLSHANAFVLTPEQYQSAQQQYGRPGMNAMTVTAQPNVMDKVLSFLGMQASPIARSAMQGPTVVTNQADPHLAENIRHEAVHALLNGVDDKMNTMAVQDLVPAQALVQLSHYYNPQEIASEIPARAVTNPDSLALSRVVGDDPQNLKGKLVASQYADMLEKQGFKQQADKYRQYFGLAPKMGIRDDTQSFQKPNEVF